MFNKQSQTTDKRVGLVYSDIYLRHRTRFHPERRERLTAVMDKLNETSLLDRLISIKPYPATVEQLTYVHIPQYIRQVEEACRNRLANLDPDTQIVPESYEVARWAAGGVLAAIDEVMQWQVVRAFCAVRPPGHHALPDRAMGFCLFNNVAIGARYAQHKYNLKRVLIIDWDAHHGNGTYDIFASDPQVFYFSIHNYPYYPGTGSAAERGEGPGLGASLNVPLLEGRGDAECIAAFKDKLLPAARKFEPELILISAGFDAHQQDPLGGMGMTTQGFGELTRIVCDLADELCSGRVVSVLEGGYNLPDLADSVVEHLRQLMADE